MPISITSGFNPGGMSVGCAGVEPDPDGDGNAAALALMHHSGHYKRDP
jgi:hypothetical protein